METTLKFTTSHEWVRDNGDGTITMGISDHAQQLLGDVVFIDLPNIGDAADIGTTFSLVESIKAASDIYAPVSGQIIETNSSLDDSPELINDDPYNGGWIAKIKLDDISQLTVLIDSKTYFASIAEE